MARTVRTDCFATQSVRSESETDLTNDTSDVGSSLDEASKTVREGLTAVKTVLKHG